MVLLPRYKGGKSKDIKAGTCALIQMILSKIALVSFITLDCKLHQKFKNN